MRSPPRPPIKELDVLVHPYYVPGEMPGRLELWKRRIGQIAKRPDHYLAIEEGPFFHHNPSTKSTNARDRREYAEFLGYARKRLGPSRILHFHSGRPLIPNLKRELDAVGYDPARIRLHYYGEYAQLCVLHAFDRTVPLLIPRNRIEKSARIMLQYCTRANAVNSIEDIRHDVRRSDESIPFELTTGRSLVRRSLNQLKSVLPF